MQARWLANHAPSLAAAAARRRLFSAVPAPTQAAALPSNLRVLDPSVFTPPPEFKYKDPRKLDRALLTLDVTCSAHDDPDEVPKTVTLAPEVFLTAVRPDVIARVVRWQRNKAMQGSHKSKTISHVAGGGIKPVRCCHPDGLTSRQSINKRARARRARARFATRT